MEWLDLLQKRRFRIHYLIPVNFVFCNLLLFHTIRLKNVATYNLLQCFLIILLLLLIFGLDGKLHY